MRPRVRRWGWRSFHGREGRAIEEQIACGRDIRCPRCCGVLEARPTTRLSAVLPGVVQGYDLDCRGCRKFHPRIAHTDRSLELLHLRQLAAAVLRA